MSERVRILLAQNNSRIVGVVVNDHEKYESHVLVDAFIASSLNALSRELEQADWFMMVKATRDWNEIARFASMWNMEGLVLIGFCEQDYQKLREFMHIHEKCLPGLLTYTGIFAVSDYYAIELIGFLQEHGIRVPEDISVAGFDDIPWCEKLHSALTSVRQDAKERAKQAVSMLVKL